MALRTWSAVFLIAWGCFSSVAMGSAIYRLAPAEAALEPLERPKKPFPKVDTVYRILNLTNGAPFSSYNSEFIVQNGELKRVKSQKINHVMDMILDRVNENLICEQRLMAGTKTSEVGPGQAWRERTVGPIDRQALHEMNARRYIDPEQVREYTASTSWGDADRMIYLESLSWLPAAEMLEIFDGKIPWTRVSEIEAPQGLGSLEVRRLAESGDAKVRLRVRRATLRLVASHSVHANHLHQLEFYQDPLPFATEYKAQGIDLPKDDDEIMYRFELGRASQISGLEGEAEQLSALAGLVMWHHAMTFEDLRTGNKSDIRAVDANIYMHALKRTHHMLYAGHFGAEDFAKGVKPNDVVLRVSLKKFLTRTLPSLGLSPLVLRDTAVKADAIDFMRYDLDWIRGGQLMNRHHPITIRLARALSGEALKNFTRDVEDSAQRAKIIKASLDIHEQISEFQFPETRAVDAYNHSKHSKIQADYFVSGFDLWSATSSVYTPALIAALANFFKGVREDLTLAAVVPQTPGGDRDLLHQLVRRGFELVRMAPDDLDAFNGPFVAKITMKRLQELSERDPEIARELKAAPVLKSDSWRALREINLLPGL